MKVTLIAHTVFDHQTVGNETPFDPLLTADVLAAGDGDLLAEFAGRACYQSWERPNPATADNQGYMANILRQGHFSVLEHHSATFYVEGVSRALLAEITRHRHLSFSVLSQRFVNEHYRTKPVMPPAMQGDKVVEEVLQKYNVLANDAYHQIVKTLSDKGLTRKQAREAARAVLPNATETKFVVTGNYRAWRDFLGKRLSEHADAEIRALAQEVLRQLRELNPHSVQDLP